MNSELKSAWFTLVIVSTALVSCLVMGAKTGFPAAFAPLGLMGLLGFIPVLFGKAKGKSNCDERDVGIAQKASLIGGMSSYLTFVLGGMAIWFVHFYQGQEQVSTDWVPGLVIAGAIVLYLARSAFIISQYTPKALGSDE